MMTVLENHELIAKISSHGAELHSLYDKTTKTEYIWQGDKTYWPWHAPICFPITGRVHNDEYIFEDKKYMLTVHGFARDYEFSLLKKTENSVIYELIYNDESLKVYPFKFSLQLEYVLLEDGLKVNYTVKNLENENKDIFFALGLHTAYNCPLEKTDDFEDYELIFEQKETAKRHFLTNGIINNETEDILNNENTLAISKKLFEKDLILLKQIKSKCITLKSKKSGKFVKVYFNNFNNVGFWTKPQGAPFICIEPWNGLPDIKDKYVDFSEKEEICKLKSNEELNCSYKIEIK